MEKMRQWSVLTGLGVVGVLAAGWFLLVSPQHAHANDLRTQAASVQQTTAGLETQIGQLTAQQKGVAAQQRTLAHIATQIPDNPALPTLIRQLSAAAHDAGVTLVSLSPGQPAPVTAAVTSTTGAPAALTQIPVAIQVTGSYFNVESFFRAVEHLDRAMMATGFTLTPNGGGSGAPASAGTGSGSADAANAAPGALNAQIQAVVFMSPEAVAATATAPLTPTAPATSTGSTAQPPSTASTAPAANPAQ